MSVRITRFALFLALASPSVLLAQGRFGRGRGVGNIQRQEGITVPTVLNPVNLLLARRLDLALSDSQFKAVIDVKRQLDSTNAPLMRRLDSLHTLFKGGKPIFEAESPLRRDSVMEANAIVQETLADVRSNISDGRARAFALLSGDQLAKAEQFESDAQKALDDQQQKGRGKSP